MGNVGCSSAIYSAGFNTSKTKISLVAGKLTFNIVSNNGKTCTSAAPVYAANSITPSQVADPTTLYNAGSTLSAFQYDAGAYFDPTGVDSNLVPFKTTVFFYFLYSEATGQYQGLYFKHVSGDNTPYPWKDLYYQTDSNGNFNTQVLNLGSSNVINLVPTTTAVQESKTKFTDYYNLASKTIAGAATQKYNVKFNFDYDINIPADNAGGAAAGLSKNLPLNVPIDFYVQFWYSLPGSTQGQYVLNYINTVTKLTNKDGTISFTVNNLPAGSYQVTSFLQITNNGGTITNPLFATIKDAVNGTYAQGFTAQMLDGSDSITGDNTQLSTYESNFSGAQSMNNLFNKISARGLMTVFEAKQAFTLSDAKDQSFNPVFNSIGSTDGTTYAQDIANALGLGGTGSCGLTSIIATKSEDGGFLAGIFNCIYSALIDPLITWASTKVTDAAGISYLPSTMRELSKIPRLSQESIYWRYKDVPVIKNA